MNCHARVKEKSPQLADGPRELCYGPTGALGQGAPPSRLRLFQSPGARDGGRFLRKLPRPSRPDGGGADGPAALDGLVSRLSSQPRAEHPACRIRDQAGLEARGRPGGTGVETDSGQAHQPADELLGVPPLAGKRTDQHAMKPFAQINPARLTGKRYWRSLDEAAATPEFQEWVTREFPEGYATVDGTNRRTLLKLMGASFGLAGLTACRRPVEHILPFSRASEGYVHGKPLHYASVATIEWNGDGRDRQRPSTGRPIKIEGNPKHPYSFGAHECIPAGVGARACTIPIARRKFSVTARGAIGKSSPHGPRPSSTFPSRATARACGSSRRRTLRQRWQAVRADLQKRFRKAQWIEYESANLDAVRRRRGAGHGAERRAALPVRQGRRRLLAGLRFPGPRFGQHPAGEAVLETPARGAAGRQDEPAVRGGGELLADGRDGGSPPAREGRRRGRVGAGTGQGTERLRQ